MTVGSTETTKARETEARATTRGQLPDAPTAEKAKAQAASGAGADTVTLDQLVFTRRPDGEIQSVERMDKSGVRTELSEEDCNDIAGADEIDEISTTLEAAFEAGMVEALAAEDDDGAQEQPAGDDAVLERLILLRLLGRRIRVDAMRRDMMRRLVLRRLVRRHVLRKAKERIKV